MRENKTLNKVRTSWKMRLIAKSIVWTVLFVLFSLCLSLIFDLPVPVMVIGVIVSIGFIYLEMRKSPSDSDLVHLVNQQFESSEYSTELVFQNPVNGLNALQQEKVLAALEKKIPELNYPVAWKDLLLTTAGLLMVLTVGWLYTGTGEKELVTKNVTEPIENMNAIDETEKDSVFLKNTLITINPPKYTGLKRINSTNLNMEVPDQSGIRWQLQFEGTPTSVWMRLNEGDSMAAMENDGDWIFNLQPSGNTLYTLNFTDVDNNTFTTPYHKLELIPDEPPTVEISGIPQFQRLDYKPGIELKMNVNLTDDYGLTEGCLVATITKGSGESVKFREQTVPFNKKIEGKKVTTSLILKPEDFNMEPGNELYFYAIASDNHEPNVQKTRTETFFFVLKDTTEIEFSLQGALGIDLMPDYFRSQLQIILDTEKLIREKDQMTEYEFNFESNALGYDQKQLRLKYGQFIGEEEDSGLEVETETELQPIDDSGENVLDEFGHNTDKENEEGQWMDRGTEHEHEASADPEAEEDPLDDFMHNHEDEETATFYTQSLKSKLRAALGEMWNSELYLRLYDPKKSLPYQYKAQELLKEIRNHARIYVQRIGFDPPPVNEAESRLTGKLKELNERSFNQTNEKQTDYPAIRNAIAKLDQVTYSASWDEEMKKALRASGDELAGLAIEFPGKYLEALNMLRSLLAVDSLNISDERKILQVKKVMEKALPDPVSIPVPANRSQNEMVQDFIENLITSRKQ